MLAPWKKNYGQPRHIKKQRHFFANKCPYSQGYGFSSGHIWMWELDCEESWVMKNWCFWTVVLDSWESHGLQHTSSPYPSPTPRVHPNPCPLSQWCHPTISSSVVPFSSCLQSFPASRSFPMTQFFSPGGQSVGASASASVLPVNSQDWFPSGLTGLISLQSMGLSRVQHHSSKVSILWHSAFSTGQLSHPYMTTGKTIALTRWTLVSKVMSLLFNMLSRLVIAFLPRSKHLLISWLQSPSAVILETPKIKSLTVSIISPSICHEVMGLDAMILIFWMLSSKPDVSLSLLFHFHQECL